MVGKGHQGVVVTCVDRASRYLIARQVEACATEPVTGNCSKRSAACPPRNVGASPWTTAASSPGRSSWKRSCDLPIYFAHPYHCWERGTNENTNGLLRQYLPKGTDLTLVTPEQLRGYVRQINHRPRKCLGFQTACEVFHARRRNSPGGPLPPSIDCSAVAEDRALLGSNPSAAAAQGQGRRCVYTTSPYPLSCLWPKAINPRGLGTESPGIECYCAIGSLGFLRMAVLHFAC